MKEEILELLKTNKQMTPGAISKAMHIKTSADMKELSVVLNELEAARLIYNDHEQYVLLDGPEWFVGRARDISANDYAIINRDQKIYVPKRYTRILMDRDEVLVKVDPHKGNEVVHIYERGITCIAGTFIMTRAGLKFRSDVDLHTSFDVVNKKAFDIQPGTKAVVKVVKYASPLQVKIIEILGQENQPGVDISAILAENEVRQDFNKQVRKEVASIPSTVQKHEIVGRHDLRDLMTVTIDGDSTKDFDDAISVEKLPNGGWKLYVHIADVSYYVPEGEAIDNEAYERGTSIYVADRVVPMLPFELSNGICSLNPNVDRLTLTCEMEFNPEGIMVDYSIYDSVIHSDGRCTYAKVNSYLDDPATTPEYEDFGEMLRDFSDLAKQLKAQTEKRGHIEFETKEPYFVLGPDGVPVEVIVRERGWSEQMIEEAMIAANVAVAHELHINQLPGMFRVHEIPDPEKLQSLVSMARVLHVPCDIDPENCDPKDIARFLNSVEDPADKEILSTVAVRSMQKARYSEENLGHYGLALDEYCHFTSPIRRYPDLLIHRMLRSHVFEKKNDDRTLAKDLRKMEKSSLHLSEMEKEAVTIERAVNDLEAAKYMENKVGEEYDGVITGVTSFGFFVGLDNTIEGLIPLRYMEDDFYNYDAETMTLTGENSQKRFALGMPVHIKVRDVNIPKRQITFDYLGDVPSQDEEIVEQIQELEPAVIEELEPAKVEETEPAILDVELSDPKAKEAE
ncbi:MAG: ribonuclease R [Allobaculum sp.]|nr:ribonuclease R [Allobaculum sp.]